MPDSIYLDHAATTPLHPAVLEVMLPWLNDGFGNPSALYRLGREAQGALDDARERVAAILNARPSEIVFTSGGSESINAALRGIAFAGQLAGTARHVVTTAIEHHAVLHTCQYLERFGIDVTYVQPDEDGLVPAESVVSAVRSDTGLVSVMLANNEVGTLQAVADIARLVRERGHSLGKRIAFHTDAIQAPGWLALDVDTLGIDALSLSAHKFGGPKGAGILYLRRGTPFLSQQTGGGQERQRRAGTENVAAIAGMAAALTLVEQMRATRPRETERLRDQLQELVLLAHPEVRVNGHPNQRLPNTLNLAFPGLSGESFVEDLDRRGVAASAGSACANITWEPSHVLIAMGQTVEQAASAVRFSLGIEQSEQEIRQAAAAITASVQALKSADTPALEALR